VQLVDEVSGQGDGRSSCPGSMIIYMLNHDELYLANGLTNRRPFHTQRIRRQRLL
jgi:hypothetical protein